MHLMLLKHFLLSIYIFTKYLCVILNLILVFWCCRNGVSQIVFIPYAAHDHDAYEKKVKEAFTGFGIKKSAFLHIV